MPSSQCSRAINWDVHHPHPSEMHEKPDMICVQSGESSLTSEVSHDNLHHQCILAEEKTEGEKLSFFILVPGLEVRLKIVITQVL